LYNFISFVTDRLDDVGMAAGSKVPKVLHEPTLKTVMMVEKAILDSKDYPTRMQLWRSLPKQIQYQTFQRTLEYLEASGKIIFTDRTIVYTGINNPKLRALLDSSVKVS